MSEANHGGPAFPWGEHGQILGGMTLRDYFAAKAMPAVIAKTGAYDHISEAKTHKLTAKLAYEIADAMLKARGES